MLFNIRVKQRGLTKGAIVRWADPYYAEERVSKYDKNLFDNPENFNRFVVSEDMGSVLSLVPLSTQNMSIFTLSIISGKARRTPFVIFKNKLDLEYYDFQEMMDNNYWHKRSIRSANRRIYKAYKHILYEGD